MGRYYDNYWPPYVSVAERRRRAAQKVAKMKKAGKEISPVTIEGRKITTTFWGGAWCKNLETYSDYENRLPRGRTYVRNGSVVDLQVDEGRVRALVSGTEMYKVHVKIKPLAAEKWSEIKSRCAGQIGSLVELLQRTLSKGVMEIVTRKGDGLFPSPREITLDCSCPDWATLCKHVAATLYGVGARLDHEPKLLFTLRGVDPAEMVAAAIDQPTVVGKARKGRVLGTDELSSVFGIDIDIEGTASGKSSTSTRPAERTRRATTTRKKVASRASKKKSSSTHGAASKQAGVRKATRKRPAAKKTAAKKKTKKATAAATGAKKTLRKKAPAKSVTAKKQAAKTVVASKRVGAKKSTTKRKTAAKKTAAKKTRTGP
jgi:uncharacterized Zn finger protein